VTPLDAALAIAARGLRVVWIRPHEKRPLFERWTELATSDPDELREQAKEVPHNAGVGIALGPQADGRYILAIDVDDQDRWLELQTEHGPLPPTLAISSARGDKCLYEVQADLETIGRLRNVTGLGKRPGVDVKLAGGQVVAPPSIHPSGTAYTWHTDLPIAVLPDAWLRAILPLLRVAPPPPPSSPPAGDLVKRAAAYLERMEPSIAGQGGHDRAFAAARKLLQDFQLSPSVALNLLYRWNQRCVPPWSLRELQHKIDDALKARISNPIQDRPRQEVHVPIQPQVQVFEPWDHDRIFAPLEPPDWLVEGLILRGSLTGFVAYGSSLKTWLIAHLCLALADGSDFLGRPVKQAPSILLDYEMGSWEVRRRVHRLAFGHSLQLEPGSFSFATMPSATLVDDRWFDAFERLFESYRFVALDSLAAAGGGVDENDQRAAAPLQRVKRILERVDGTCGTIHHYRKGSKDKSDDPRELVRGSSAIFAAFDSIYGLSKSRNGSLLAASKFRGGPSPDPILVRLTDSQGGTRVEAEGTQPEEVKEEDAHEQLEALKRRCLMLLGGVRDLRSVDAIGVRLKTKKSVARQVVRELEDSGVVVKFEGNYRLSSEVKK
jgi:hypothetical protein